MTNLNLLNTKIKYDGIKLTVLAIKLGMSRTTLWSRLRGDSIFTREEIKDICKVLHLNEKERQAIFNYDPHSCDISRWSR